MEKEFTERELSGFGDFSDLPEDLRNTGPITMPDGSFAVPTEMDMFGTAPVIPYTGTEPYPDPYAGIRTVLQPIPPGLGSSVTWTSTKYLPRANYESFRSSRFSVWGRANLPAGSTIIDLTSSNTAVTDTGGILEVPSGYAAVLTGIRQWIGDPNAYNKSSGEADDVSWRILVANNAILTHGNFAIIASDSANEAKLFAIANEGSAITIAASNTVATTDARARTIPVSAIISGYWFPIDEIDDIFRNK